MRCLHELLELCLGFGQTFTSGRVNLLQLNLGLVVSACHGRFKCVVQLLYDQLVLGVSRGKVGFLLALRVGFALSVLLCGIELAVL